MMISREADEYKRAEFFSRSPFHSLNSGALLVYESIFLEHCVQVFCVLSFECVCVSCEHWTRL